MATTSHTVKGKAYWSKLFYENRDELGYQGAAVPYEGFYTLQVMLDKAQKAIHKASGTAGKGKFDDDGNFFASFKRKHKDRYEKESGPPMVTKPDGSKWDYEADGFIPNGSEVEVDFDVYTTTKANGTRLKAVRVLSVAEMPPMEEKKEEVKEEPKSKGKYDSDIPF